MNEEKKLTVQEVKKLPEVYFDDYFDIGEKLGEGSFGKVFKVKSLEDDKDYALKIFKPQNDDDLKDSIQEYNLLSELGKNCVHGLVCYYKIYKTFYNSYAILMDLIKGKELRKVMESKIGLKQKEIIFIQLCNALNLLHSHNLVHRDIKPENIIYDKDKHQMYLIDVGMICSTNIKNKEYICSLDSRGTIIYLPPEILIGEEKDIKLDMMKPADIWAMGAVFYEIYTGQDFIKNTDSYETIKKEMNEFIKNYPTWKPKDKIMFSIKQMLNPEYKKRWTISLALSAFMSLF